MSDFIEFETNKGRIVFNMNEISHVQSSGDGTEAIINLKSGISYIIEDEYENVMGYLMWVADGCPEIEHREDCEHNKNTEIKSD